MRVPAPWKMPSPPGRLASCQPAVASSNGQGAASSSVSPTAWSVYLKRSERGLMIRLPVFNRASRIRADLNRSTANTISTRTGTGEVVKRMIRISTAPSQCDGDNS